MDLKIYPQPGDKFKGTYSTFKVTNVAPGLVWYEEYWNLFTTPGLLSLKDFWEMIRGAQE